jgi:hypothetical protein
MTGGAVVKSEFGQAEMRLGIAMRQERWVGLIREQFDRGSQGD